MTAEQNASQPAAPDQESRLPGGAAPDGGSGPPGRQDAGAAGSTWPDPGGAAPADRPDRAATPEPVYTAVEDWVIDYFLPMFRRTLGGEFRWCGQWWRHGEAISRLTCLWHAWEVLRLQPGTGMAAWYRDHLDHQLPILMGARGPFYQCSETAHREPHEAATTASPGEWWDSPLGAWPDGPPPGAWLDSAGADSGASGGGLAPPAVPEAGGGNA